MIKGLVVEQRYNVYYVSHNNQIFLCKPKGLLKFNNNNVTVGDHVIFDQKTCTITEVLKRSNLLIRPKVANIDQAIVVMSLIKPDFNFELLVKYLIQLETNFISSIIICLTKSDLIDKNDKTALNIIKQLKTDHYPIYDINDSNDFLKFKKCFSDKTSIMVGQTGVGKSTIINKILDKELLKTQEISLALNRGKHTTTGTRLISFLNGYIADSPGFSSFEYYVDRKSLSKSFSDFNEYATKCQFNDCMHNNEINCNVKKQLINGKISQWRYEWYISCIKEKKNEQQSNKRNKKNSSR